MRFKFIKFCQIFIFIVILAFASTSQASQPNDVLISAMSPFENITEYALAGKDSDISKALTVAEQQSKDVMANLPAPASRKFSSLMDSLHKAVLSKNNLKSAKYAVDIYLLLADNLQAGSLDIPKEVILLDYAGFKLRVLVAAKQPDWRDIQKTVDEANKWWSAIKPNVTTKGLVNTFDTLSQGLETSLKTRNRAMLDFAAKMILDLVDLLEGDFKAKSKAKM